MLQLIRKDRDGWPELPGSQMAGLRARRRYGLRRRRRVADGDAAVQSGLAAIGWTGAGYDDNRAAAGDARSLGPAATALAPAAAAGHAL